MAVIGLLDWDLTRWKQPTVFNLELMKLAYYHKVLLRDIVQMEYKFSSEMCSQVFIQKDYEDFEYPPFITSDPKVTWRGLALSDGVYSPLPLEIEQCPADTSIYEGFAKYYKRTQDSQRVYKSLMSACHLRLTLDGEHPFEGWEKQIDKEKESLKYLVFHDKNLRAIESVSKIIKDVANYYGRSNLKFGFKFPLSIQSPDDLWDWGRLAKITGLSNANLYTLMPDQLLDQITPFKQTLTYYIKSPEWTAKTFIDSLSKIFIQAMFLSSHNITLLLKFDRDFIIDQRWHQFVEMFNSYIESCVIYRHRLVYCCFTYCKYCYDKLVKEEKIELFNFIKQQNSELFDFLYGLEYATFENGIFVPHMYTSQEFAQGGGYGGYFYKRANKGKNQSEQFNYAEIIQPDRVYLE